MRPYQVLLIVLLILSTGFCALFFHGQWAYGKWEQRYHDRFQIGKALGMGHLILSTEAPYLRHFGYGSPTDAFNMVISGFDLTLGSSFFLPPDGYLNRALPNNPYGN